MSRRSNLRLRQRIEHDRTVTSYHLLRLRELELRDALSTRLAESGIALLDTRRRQVEHLAAAFITRPTVDHDVRSPL